MGSSTQAYHDMLEEEEHKRNIENAKIALEKLTPQIYHNKISAMEESISAMRKCSMVGSEALWTHFKTLEILIKSMK